MDNATGATPPMDARVQPPPPPTVDGHQPVVPGVPDIAVPAAQMPTPQLQQLQHEVGGGIVPSAVGNDLHKDDAGNQHLKAGDPEAPAASGGVEGLDSLQQQQQQQQQMMMMLMLQQQQQQQQQQSAVAMGAAGEWAMTTPSPLGLHPGDAVQPETAPTVLMGSMGHNTAALSRPGAGTKRGRKSNTVGMTPTKRRRAKKPADAPRRPKSAYMFFLAEFREQWKKDNPDSRKVSDVAKAAGEAWRALSDDSRREYEEKSNDDKAEYARLMQVYTQEHPRPHRRNKRDRGPGELKRPQSAYFFFLADFREAYQREHPNEQPQVALMGKLAGDKWKSMTPGERAPYEEMSAASKAEYKRLKEMSEDERMRAAAAAAMQAANPMVPVMEPASADQASEEMVAPPPTQVDDGIAQPTSIEQGPAQDGEQEQEPIQPVVLSEPQPQ